MTWCADRFWFQCLPSVERRSCAFCSKRTGTAWISALPSTSQPVSPRRYFLRRPCIRYRQPAPDPHISRTGSQLSIICWDLNLTLTIDVKNVFYVFFHIFVTFLTFFILTEFFKFFCNFFFNTWCRPGRQHSNSRLCIGQQLQAQTLAASRNYSW